MNRGLALFLARLFTNPNRDLFSVRLGVTLLLGKFNITGPLATGLGYLLRCTIGLIIEDGSFMIDVAIDSYKEGKKLKEFEKAASEAYAKATAKIYDEDQKNEIRKEYLKIISAIGNVGNPK